MNNEKKYISDQKLIAKRIDFFNKFENFTLDNVANLLENHPEYLNMPEEKSGCTLLFKAVNAGNYDIVEFLLDLNADPDKQNIYGETPLHQAVENGNYKIINILLERGANPNIQQQDGESPMHIAAVRGEYKIIKLLMLFGASPFIYTFDGGLTPLDYARESGKAESLSVLKPLFDESKKSRNNLFQDNEQENGFRTTKNSSSQFHKVKNEIDLVHPPVFEFSQPINNTSKNSSINNNKFHNRHHSTFDIFNLNNVNFNKIKDLNQPILCTNLNNSINNNSNSNVAANNKKNNNFSNSNLPDSFVTNNDSSHIEINQENEYRTKRKNRNKFHSEVNNNDILKKNSFNLINNFNDNFYHYSNKNENDCGNVNANLAGEKYSNLWANKSVNVKNNVDDNKKQAVKQHAILSKEGKGKEALISGKAINEYLMSEKNLKRNSNKNLNYNLNKKIDENGVFDTKKEVVYKNNLLISEDSSKCANSRNNINSNLNDLTSKELNYNSNKLVNVSNKKDFNYSNIKGNNLLMEVIDEHINSLNTNTMESHFDERNHSDLNNLKFEFTERTNLNKNSYRENFEFDSNRGLGEFIQKDPSFEASANLKYLDAENTISEIENSPFAILNENPSYKNINNYKLSSNSNNNNPNVSAHNKFNNESEENLSENNIPHINTEENFDLERQRSSDKIANLDYEVYIRNNFRNSTTLESEQLKELREMDFKGKINNFVNINPNINSNFNFSEINNNGNYNNNDSEFTEGNNSIQNTNMNYNNYNADKSKNNKNNFLLATPKDAKINPNSNSYSFTRNQTPNFFYSKGKIPTNSSNYGFSLQKLDSRESFGAAEFSENKANIQVNKSTKAFENNFNKNMQNLSNDIFNSFNDNNSNANYNQQLKPAAKSKAFVNDLPFNYNSNSNFNFSNINMIKDPESMSHISNINDNESNLNKRLDTKNFTLNYDDNRLITLKPEEYVDTFENKLDFTGITFNSTNKKNNKNEKNNKENYATPEHDFNYNYYGIDYPNENNKSDNDYNFDFNNNENKIKEKENIKENTNKRRIPNLNDDVYNMPLQQKKNKNYAIGASKINDSYLKDALVEKNIINNSAKKGNEIFEKFYDADRKPLAVFFSSKNDIGVNLNEKRFNETFEKGNFNTFTNNFINTNNNISINQNYVFDNNDNIYETLNSDGDVVNVNNNNTFCSVNTDKKRKSFRQSLRSKKVSFDAQNRNSNNANGQRGEKAKHKRNESYKNKFPFGNESYMTYRSEVDISNSDAYKEIFGFLKQINLEDFTFNFLKNGFDDLNLLVNQIKSDLAINDLNLKDIGISCPGDRAKILIKLEEESRSFLFDIPASVYYSAGSFDKIRTAEILNDIKLTGIYKWLQCMKLDKFTRNFVINGYHSLDLLFIQMVSKNPLTEKILDEELQIEKIGYRIRILNKLKEDAKEYVEKLKNSTCITAAKNDLNHESCKCTIF